ncbi:hypothetical protein BX666DRAFT_1260723 [Dichotomocladium elegans]|nr:hypothetical protein BX666DRAFT_1260723 [Dichotomocladium elegans]
MASYGPADGGHNVLQHQQASAMHPGATQYADDNQYYDRATHSSNSAHSVEEGVMEEYSEKPPPPPRKRFYKNKRYWIVCSILTVIIVVVAVLLIVFVFFPMIAQSLINKSSIGVDKAQITFSPPSDTTTTTKRQEYDMNSTFYMNMGSTLRHTGPFAATIQFHNPINVYYNKTIFLGTITLPETKVSGGSGKLNAITAFQIQDTAQFASFAKDMLANEEFTWTLKGKLDINALSRTATIDLNKDIVMKGMNGFPKVSITSFNLPSNAPGGGIVVELGTVLVSPSPIGVQLGTIAMDIGYDGVYLGQVKADNVNLSEGDNNIPLKGVLVPQTDPAALEKISGLFSNYVAGKMSTTSAIGVSAAPDGTNPINWLSDGFKSVRLNVGLGLDKPMDIIKAVSMGYLDLTFSSEQPYAPVTNAPAVVADFQIPFGFSLNITQVSQELALGTNTTGKFATISVPYVPSQSDQAAGKLQFAMTGVPITTMPGKEALFDDFTYSLTASELYSFQVSGNASTQTVTPIGNITLSGISFEVPTSLHGLQFLNSTPTVVNSVDMVGGSSAGLQLAINVTMGNPSDFSMTTGDVNFAFLSSGTQLGNVVLSNLTLARGNNIKTAASTFDPNSSPVGSNLLSTFVMGQNNDVNIAGFDGSTNIASLSKALQAISIGTTLPGLQSTLIQSAKLTVNEDSPKSGVVSVQVSIANPFTASLAIPNVVSSVTYQGMPVGNINQDISGSPITIPGHSTVQSQGLDMSMNVEPAAVALLLRQLAVAAGLNTDALDALYTMGGLSIEGARSIQGNSALFEGFNISEYTMAAMKALRTDLQLQTGLNVGEYSTTLQFSQNDVAVETDGTVTRLIPIVGQPIVQQIVDGALLSFETIMLSAPTDSAFTVQMKGSITNAGPFAAEIAFPNQLTVAWEGSPLGTVGMPTIKTVADQGANFDVTGTFTVVDQAAMGKFAGYLINNADFQWNIYTENVAVTGLGYTFVNISMNKYVTLDGANGFKNAVAIEKFDLPSSDGEGIVMTAITSITNPSQVGFNLNGAGFSAWFKDIQIATLNSDGPAVFNPKATSHLQMKGHMIPQKSEEGLAAVTEVFETYLHAKDSLLDILGESGSGPQGQVGWLTAGFKTLKIEDVVLPGPDTPPELIPAITMKNMQIDFTKSAYAPPAGSTQVEAQLKNPFGFPLGVTQLNMNVIAGLQGHKVASLDIPDEPATTSPTGLVTTSFSDVPFKVFKGAEPLFNQFVKALTLSPNVAFDLSGSSNAVTQTAIGNLKLNNITFDVTTSLAGFNDFGGSFVINSESVKVVGATKEYIVITLSIQLNNPSQITITLGDMNLDIYMNEFNAMIGTSFLTGVTIVPGMNTLNSEIHMGGTSTAALLQMLSNFMTGATTPLTLKGSEKSTEIASLKDGLGAINMGTTMSGIQDKLLVSTDVIAGLGILGGEAKTKINLYNPLDTPFTIMKVEAVVKTTIGGSTFQVGHIDYTLSNPFTLGPKSHGTTDEWPVKVDANLIQLLKLLFTPDLKLDITQNATIAIDGKFGAILYYYQNSVPAKINVDLDLGCIFTGTCTSSDSSAAFKNLLTPDVVAQLPNELKVKFAPLLAPPASANSTLSATPASSGASASASDGATATEDAAPTSTHDAAAEEATTPTEKEENTSTAPADEPTDSPPQEATATGNAPAPTAAPNV